MPEYPIPPWLRPPPDPGEQYIQAYGAGASIAAHQAEAAANSQRIALASQQADREHLMKQQQFEIARQQSMLEYGLKKSELQQTAQMNEYRMRAAAQQYAAQQKYNELAPRIGAVQASLEAGPALFQGTGWSQLVRAAQANRYGQLTPNEMVRQLTAQIKELESGPSYNRYDLEQAKKSAQPGETPQMAMDRARSQQLDQLRRQRNRIIYGEAGGPYPPEATVPEGVTAPKSDARIRFIKEEDSK